MTTEPSIRQKKLIIPENIILIFLPPYSPELNPAEKIWWQLKQEFVCKSFNTIDQLGKHLAKVVRRIITTKTVKKICSFKYLLCSF
ncbi:MAG: transposase [Crocinitomicaceae bacterium]|nr:transposase [Crocinitomicaceae bacterium]